MINQSVLSIKHITRPGKIAKTVNLVDGKLLRKSNLAKKVIPVNISRKLIKSPATLYLSFFKEFPDPANHSSKMHH